MVIKASPSRSSELTYSHRQITKIIIIAKHYFMAAMVFMAIMVTVIVVYMAKMVTVQVEGYSFSNSLKSHQKTSTLPAIRLLNP